jgi:hypothetical protein
MHKFQQDIIVAHMARQTKYSENVSIILSGSIPNIILSDYLQT